MRLEYKNSRKKDSGRPLQTLVHLSCCWPVVFWASLPSTYHLFIMNPKSTFSQQQICSSLSWHPLPIDFLLQELLCNFKIMIGFSTLRECLCTNLTKLGLVVSLLHVLSLILASCSIDKTLVCIFSAPFSTFSFTSIVINYYSSAMVRFG